MNPSIEIIKGYFRRLGKKKKMKKPCRNCFYSIWPKSLEPCVNCRVFSCYGDGGYREYVKK